MGDLDRRILEDFGLDGHWLFSVVIAHVPECKVDLHANQTVFGEQFAVLLEDVTEDIYNDILNGCIAKGLDDDALAQIDLAVEEELPTLASTAELILTEVYNILRNYRSPPHCASDTIDYYLVGYSTRHNHGCLHFQFTDP